MSYIVVGVVELVNVVVHASEEDAPGLGARDAQHVDVAGRLPNRSSLQGQL